MAEVIDAEAEEALRIVEEEERREREREELARELTPSPSSTAKGLRVAAEEWENEPVVVADKDIEPESAPTVNAKRARDEADEADMDVDVDDSSKKTRADTVPLERTDATAGVVAEGTPV